MTTRSEFIHELIKAINFDPDNPYTYVLLGDVMGGESVKITDSVIFTDEPISSITLLNGKTLTFRQSFLEAIRLGEKNKCKYNINLSNAYSHLGLFIRDNEKIIISPKRTMNKKKLFIKAIETFPENVIAYIHLGVLLSKNGYVLIDNKKYNRDTLFNIAIKCNSELKPYLDNAIKNQILNIIANRVTRTIRNDIRQLYLKPSTLPRVELSAFPFIPIVSNRD